MLRDFKKFALRGNVVDMAVGFTVGAAFATIAKSLVDDILMPPIGLLIGNVDFSDRFWLLRGGAGSPPPYERLSEAREAGAVTINYGAFLNNVLAFLIIAVAVFLVVRGINRVDEKLEDRFGQQERAPEEPTDKKCRYCLSTIPYQAIRCPRCTSDLDSSPNPV